MDEPANVTGQTKSLAICKVVVNIFVRHNEKKCREVYL